MFYHGYQNKRILYTDISVFQLIRSLICRCHCIISFGLALYLFCTFFQIEFKIWNIIKKKRKSFKQNLQKKNINLSWEKLYMNNNLSILEKKNLFYNVFKLVSIDQCN